MLLFFFNDTATTEIYTLSLHDALPISQPSSASARSCSTVSTPSAQALSPSPRASSAIDWTISRQSREWGRSRSEEHTSELQSRQYLVCRLLLEKKKNCTNHRVYIY